jgi:aminoglycoside phosphotransferase (APT) family kinase protein
MHMEISPETIEQLVRQAFPQASVVSCRPLESGVTNRSAERSRQSLNYALQLQNPTTEIALRVYQPDTPQGRLDKEMYVLRVAMPETGVPTPRVIHFDDSRTLVDRPYAVLNLLPGEPLQKVLPHMDELDQEAVGYEMGRYLVKLHSIPLEQFGEFLGQDPLASASEKAYTVARVTEWLDICERNDLLDEPAIAELRRFVERTRTLNRESACFVHGDYHQGNVIVKEGVAGFHVTGVFDFEHAQGWSPEWDMATLLSRVSDEHPALAKGFLDGYADTAGLPQDLWERLRVYQAVVYIALVVHAHRLGDAALLKTHRARLYRFLEEDTQG